MTRRSSDGDVATVVRAPFTTQEPIGTRVARALREAASDEHGTAKFPGTPTSFNAATPDQLRAEIVAYIQDWCHAYAVELTHRNKPFAEKSETHRYAMASNVCEMLARHVREAELEIERTVIPPLRTGRVG